MVHVRFVLDLVARWLQDHGFRLDNTSWMVTYSQICMKKDGIKPPRSLKTSLSATATAHGYCLLFMSPTACRPAERGANFGTCLAKQCNAYLDFCLERSLVSAEGAGTGPSEQPTSEFGCASGAKVRMIYNPELCLGCIRTGLPSRLQVTVND